MNYDRPETTAVNNISKSARVKRPVSKIADRDTPLIKNCWYVLDWSEEIKRELKNRMVLNQDLVYFRGNDNDVSVLQNRCAHRGFPLHRSKLCDDDTIQCGYHGLTYNQQGKCVKIPSDAENKNPKISIQSYPVIERYPMVWIWPGNPRKANPDLIPDYNWVNGENWGYGKGNFHVKGNYLAIHENLLDLTHFQFLHGAVLGSPGQTESKIDVLVDGNTVDTQRVNRGDPVPLLHKEATGLGDVPILRYASAKFETPGFHRGNGKFEDPSGSNNGRIEYHPRILHFITPETQYTSFYWWIFARDFNPKDKILDTFYTSETNKVFEEDKEAIEWIEELWANEDRPDYREKHVPSDEGAVKMRRIVAQLSAEEIS